MSKEMHQKKIEKTKLRRKLVYSQWDRSEFSWIWKTAKAKDSNPNTSKQTLQMMESVDCICAESRD